MVLMALQSEPLTKDQLSNEMRDCHTEPMDTVNLMVGRLVEIPINNSTTNLVDLSTPSSSSSDSSPSRQSEESGSNATGSRPSLIDELLEVEDTPNNNYEIINDNEPEPLSVSDDHNCLLHPGHRTILNKLAASKNTISSLQDNIQRLEEKINVDASLVEKFPLLEQAVIQQEKELELCRQEHEIDLKTIDSLKNEMETKISTLKKQCDSSNKEKENMVMRYAKNEKELLELKKTRETLDKKVKDLMKESESTQAKLKALSVDKAKVVQSLDSKVSELSSVYKELDKLKDEINSRDIKIKWTQNKLKTEMENHGECSSTIEKLKENVKTLQEELEAFKNENHSLQRQLDGSEVNKHFECQLKENQAKLIMEKHEKTELEVKLKELSQSQQVILEENENLSSQILSLEQARLALNKRIISLTEERDSLDKKVIDLEADMSEMEEIRRQLSEEKERSVLSSSEMEKLRKSHEDLLADMNLCRNREAEMLQFTQKLTEKNVILQTEVTAVGEKASELVKEEELLEKTSFELKEKVAQLKEALKEEQSKRHEESRLLARQVAEKTTKALNLESLLTDTQSELNLLRQKHTTALKELQKELTLHRKKVDQLECNGRGGGSSASGSDSMCQGSRTSSLSSLNDNSSSPYQVLDVPAHTLIERIVKLQNDCAKQTERVEFLEEHTAHLVKELQKKSKLLQNYILREQTGALTSKIMDKNKAELSKHGGIMASLYSSKPSESMTLELSMEINRKLQAVLEDTLLKNITLKENLDTLGDEIARLSQKKT